MRFHKRKFYETLYAKRTWVIIIAVLDIIGSWAIGFSYKSPLIVGIGLATATVILIILSNALKSGEYHVSETNTPKQIVDGTEREGN